jgi:hypothetical protein
MTVKIRLEMHLNEFYRLIALVDPNECIFDELRGKNELNLVQKCFLFLDDRSLEITIVGTRSGPSGTELHGEDQHNELSSMNLVELVSTE